MDHHKEHEGHEEDNSEVFSHKVMRCMNFNTPK